LSFLYHSSAPRIVGAGEAMIEFAPVGGGHFKRGFAGDTLNTSWYLRQLLPEALSVSYATCIGADAISNEFISFLESSGIETAKIARDAQRTLGLYTITLDGAERHFSYWRDNSAARLLADDPAYLEQAFSGAALVYVSGITLAVIGEQGRENLMKVLAGVRRSGARIAFDSNIRLRLWPDEKTAKRAIEAFLPVCDVAMPGFDDEAALWKDAAPKATAKRLRDLGVREVVVKNGASAAFLSCDDIETIVDAKPVQDSVDTTAAGDSFNAGYLAARCMGHGERSACTIAHALAAQVIRHPGALIPQRAIAPLQNMIAEGKT
jgi:2-dehydro-3-deoxygluconokinase